MCYDGSMANCCRKCKKDLKHEHSLEGECLIRQKSYVECGIGLLVIQ